MESFCDRLDHEERAMLGLAGEVRSLLGLPRNASNEEFSEALNEQWDSMSEDKRNRIAYLTLEVAQIGSRLMARIEGLVPEAAAQKQRFTAQALQIEMVLARSESKKYSNSRPSVG